MRTFDMTEQIERLTASGTGRVQGIQDDDYRRLWPRTIELPAQHEGRFDRALIVDAYPLYPMPHPMDHGEHRVTHPARFVPLPNNAAPTKVVFDNGDRGDLEPLDHPYLGPLLRYIIFWQDGARWKNESPNAAVRKFDRDECGLRLIEGLHLALQCEELIRARTLALCAHVDAHGRTQSVHWSWGAIPSFALTPGMFVDPNGVPSRATHVVPVSNEDSNLFRKD